MHCSEGGPPPGAEVLVVGDSLEVLTSPYLERRLRGADLTVSAYGGYSSTEVLELLKQSFEPTQSVIVFDAGTNDDPAHPEMLAGNLERVAEVIEGRRLVVPTVHGGSDEGSKSSPRNRVIARFAAQRPGTSTPDWAGAVRERPELLQPDDLHPTPEGAAFRAELIAESVRWCLESASGPGAEAATPQPRSELEKR